MTRVMQRPNPGGQHRVHLSTLILPSPTMDLTTLNRIQVLGYLDPSDWLNLGAKP